MGTAQANSLFETGGSFARVWPESQSSGVTNFGLEDKGLNRIGTQSPETVLGNRLPQSISPSEPQLFEEPLDGE